MKSFFTKLFQSEAAAISYWVFLALASSLHKVWRGTHELGVLELYRNAFLHLNQGLDPYLQNGVATDFKYAPSFSALIAPFASLPLEISAVLWNLFVTLSLVISIRFIQGLESKQRALIFWVSHIELLTALQNFQINPLITALMVAFLGFLQRGKMLEAGLMLAWSLHTKIFGVTIAILALRENKRKSLVLWTLSLSALLTFVPFLFTEPQLLFQSYRSWIQVLTDKVVGADFSFGAHQIFQSLSLNINREGFNFLFLVLSLSVLSLHGIRKQLTLVTARNLSIVLLNVVLFNHTTESPTFVIAMTGVGIWFAISKKTPLTIGLCVLAIVLTSLSPTVFFPRDFFGAHLRWIKPLPCFLIWIHLLVNQLREILNRENEIAPTPETALSAVRKP